jgi:hypothetical protein
MPLFRQIWQHNFEKSYMYFKQAGQELQISAHAGARKRELEGVNNPQAF